MIPIPFFKLGAMISFDRNRGMPPECRNYLRSLSNQDERMKKWPLFEKLYAPRSEDIEVAGCCTRGEISARAESLTSSR